MGPGSDGEWQEEYCHYRIPFMCEVEYKVLKETEEVNLKFTKDQLTFSSFHVWYKYKAVDEKLLASTKGRGMTGVRFNWNWSFLCCCGRCGCCG